MTNRPIDPVLRSARREAVAVFLIWLAALAYTITYCYFHGYGRRLDDLTYVWGFPDWVFWGIVSPWAVCVIVSWGFSYLFMTDEDLGDGDVGEDDIWETDDV